MNLVHENRISNQRFGQPRSGLTIIEVLTSIVVAMIGVFGVMILIPFAVKQAQTGLDSDAAVMVGRNAHSQFEIFGHTNPTNWVIHVNGAARRYSPYEVVGTNNQGDSNRRDTPEVLSIDPLGILENGATTVPLAYGNAVFPFNMLTSGFAMPAIYRIRTVNLVSSDGSFMSTAVARRMFRTADDLVFGEAVDELLGPEQVFDGPGFLRRQSGGRLSWSAIVVPYKPDGTTANTRRWSYKMYILVYKDRSTLITDTDGQMLTARLDPKQNVGVHSPVTNVRFEENVTVEPTSTKYGVSRDDWVMLINRTLNSTDDGSPPPGVTYAEKGFDKQIAFYRVVNAADGVASLAYPANLATMTLDGPDFNFGDPDDVDSLIDPNMLIQETYAVHLKDVIAIYERTFEPENASNWN